MKLQTAILIFSGVLLCGCTSVEFVRKETYPQKQAVLRYQPSSKPNKEAKSRAELEKKAHEFCAGDYEITKEYQSRQNTGASTGVGTGLGIGMGGIMVGASQDNSAMYNMVELSCKQSGTQVK
ncbi:hypothetical protein AZI86_15925 [Bdellovibrio bacteriovorus]|uniref:Lipoprotein n=1 Tax=Bdellovibrio bacteriovorus TaxID=959 RepID=A0A150WHU2_BDEBC|nr:hypothetical protein [Bdellovibrio bacteriovorus]KYG63190.1 hypothetical protein AZI86_15925 [Bdellovibrio bacteriovorus]